MMEQQKLVRLVNRAKDGDQQAFEELLREAHTPVSYQCRKMLGNEQDAEDMTQEILITIYTKLDTLAEPAAFYGWLGRITANQCKNALRKHKDLQFAEDEEGHSVLDELEDLDERQIPDKALDNAETARMIDEIVSELPEAQRMTTLLYYYNEMSVREIAAAMGTNENAVKGRLNLARKAIKTKVEGYEKQGIKLYSTSVLPLLWYFLRKAAEEQADAAVAEACVAGVMAGGTAAAVAAGTATAAAGTAATATAAGTAAGTAFVGKIVAGILAGTLALGGVGMGISWLAEPTELFQPATTISVPAASTPAEPQPSESVTQPSIPATNSTEPIHTHTYSAIVTAPTCTDSGYTTHTCDCGDSYVDNAVKALDHSYSAVVTPPTETEQGYTTHTCDNCCDSYVDSYTEPSGSTSILSSGTCGEYLIWRLDNNGLLTISGTGAMTEWDYDFDSPWQNYNDQITSVTIEAGVTSIGSYAFRFCTNITSVSIPNGITSIGHSAFAYCTGLGSIAIPESVVSIAAYAFSCCYELTSITVEPSNTVFHSSGNCIIETQTGTLILGCNASTIPADGSIFHIGNDAFYNCSDFNEIVIPNGVISIGESAFMSCHNLRNIVIPQSVTHVDPNAFWDCSLTNITVDSSNPTYHSDGNCIIETATNTLVLGCGTSVIPSDGSVNCIGRDAFSNSNNLIGIIIPDTVSTISDSAFSFCFGLTDITIPNSITKIGTAAFKSCTALTSIHYEGTMVQWNAIEKADNWDNNTGNYTIYCTDGEISTALEHTHSYDAVVTPPTCTEKGYTTYTCNCGNAYTDSEVAAMGHSYTAVVTLPTETEQGYTTHTCANCGECYMDNYTEPAVLIVNGTCGENLIWYLDESGQLTVAGTGPMIGQNYNTEMPWYDYRLQITSAVIQNGITNIGEAMFRECAELTSVSIGSCVSSIDESAFYECSKLKYITLPDSVTNIGQIAFYGCSGLIGIRLPDSDLYIGNSAFYGCSSLTDISLPEGVSRIGYRTFYGCTSLTSITIPDKVTTIGSDAFCDCSSLTSVTISRNVNSIDYRAFAGCVGLTSIVIPDSVDGINVLAFGYCTGLVSIYYEGTIEQWNAVEKRSGWDSETGEYTIYCTDGEIPKMKE